MPMLALDNVTLHRGTTRVLDSVSLAVNEGELVALLITAALAAYTLWAVSDYMLFAAQAGYVTQGLIVIPEWVPQVSFLLGMLIFLVAVLDELAAVLRRQKPVYQRAEEERAASGDFSETV